MNILRETLREKVGVGRREEIVFVVKGIDNEGAVCALVVVE